MPLVGIGQQGLLGDQRFQRSGAGLRGIEQAHIDLVAQHAAHLFDLAPMGLFDHAS